MSSSHWRHRQHVMTSSSLLCTSSRHKINLTSKYYCHSTGELNGNTQRTLLFWFVFPQHASSLKVSIAAAASLKWHSMYPGKQLAFCFSLRGSATHLSHWSGPLQMAAIQERERKKNYFGYDQHTGNRCHTHGWEPAGEEFKCTPFYLNVTLLWVSCQPVSCVRVSIWLREEGVDITVWLGMLLLGCLLKVLNRAFLRWKLVFVY